MKFCQECLSKMTKKTNAAGAIVFHCHCGSTEPGRPDDTLMAEGTYEKAENDQTHDVFIDNSPHDLAGNKVMKTCPDCNLDFVTMIRIGTNEMTMYSCSCGWRATHNEYMRNAMVIPPAKKVVDELATKPKKSAEKLADPK